MIAGPTAPGVGEFRYQPGLESGSSTDGTSTDPSGLSPSSMSGELIPTAGTDRWTGGDAGSTGPTVSVRVCVGLGAAVPVAAGSGAEPEELGAGRATAGELPAARVGAGTAAAAPGKDPCCVSDPVGWAVTDAGPDTVPQAATPMRRAAVSNRQARPSLRFERFVGPP